MKSNFKKPVNKSQQVNENNVTDKKSKKPISKKRQSILLKIITILVTFSAVFFSFHYNFWFGLINVLCVFLFNHIAKLPVKEDTNNNEK